MLNRTTELAITETETDTKPELKAVSQVKPTETVIVIEFIDTDLSEKKYKWDIVTNLEVDLEYALTHKRVLKLFNTHMKRYEFIPVSRINRIWEESK